MYYLDAQRDRDGSDIYRTKTNFNLPLKKTRQGDYKISSGTLLHVCMTSDFFLEEADEWREEVWDMIRERLDVTFWIQTKRAEKIAGKFNVPCVIIRDTSHRIEHEKNVLRDILVK